MKKLILGLMAGLFCLNVNAEAPKIAEACFACHGQNGVSNSPTWPNLAGQQRDYLAKQMRDFRDGARVDPAMSASLLDAMSDEQILQLADYFTALEVAKPAAIEDGKPGQHERAYCVSCHGMNGTTVTSQWPNLSAQKEEYLKKQLLDYKSGKRQHPIMQVIASELTEQQLADVAKYYSQH